MKRNTFIVICLFTTLFLSIGTGTVSAGNGGVSASTGSVTIISGHKKKVTINVSANNVKGVHAQDPLQVISSKGKGDSYQVTVKAGTPKTIKTVHIYIETLNGERQVQVVVVPYTQQRNNQAVSAKQKEQAQKYRNFTDTWIAKRTHTVPTSGGVKTVYQQYDPTKGPKFPGTNIPEGAWVSVPYNTTTNQPEWLFNNPNQEMAYVIQRAHAAHARNTWMVGISAVIAIVPNIIGLLIYPWYRRRKETLTIWPSVNWRGD